MTSPFQRLLIAAMSLAACFAATAEPVSVAPAASAASDAAPAAMLVEGEVRKVDAALQKITLRHAEIPNIPMPPMTMVFQVADASLLSTVVVGDKVRFAAEKRSGAFVVTHLQPAP